MEQKHHYLTDRQLEITLLACQGYSNKEIASLAGGTKDTIKNTLTDAMRKLGVCSRHGFPRRLIELGYLDAESLPKPIDRRAGGKYNAFVTLCSGQQAALQDKFES